MRALEPEFAAHLAANGYRGANWTLRNKTNSTDEYIRGLETAALYPDNNQMSIAATRPAAGGRK